MSDDRKPLDPELAELFLVEIARRASTIASAVDDPRSAQRTLHSLRGSAAMMGATTLATRISALEAGLREDAENAAPALLDSLATALIAAGFDATPLLSPPPVTRSSRPAIVPTPVPAADDLSRASSPPDERISLEPPMPAQPSVEPPKPVSSMPPAERPSQERLPIDPSASRSGARNSVDPDIRAFFVSEAYGRLELFSSSIVRADNAESEQARADALREAFRHAHSIKGSASTVGFHGIALAAHAIESALAGTISTASDNARLASLADAATLLAAALAVPEQAESCAADVQKVLRDAGFTLETPALRAPTRPSAEPARASDGVRVPSTALHSLGERLTDIAAVGERVSGASARSIEFGRALSGLSVSLDEAIRRLGPPRPWGVAADVLERFHSVSRFLRDAALALEGEGVGISREADALSSITTEARDGLQQMSVTSARWLFDRVVTVANASARTSQKELRVVRDGEEVELPRAVGERLVEPLAQLVRNAVVHGIESPTRRIARHKSVRGVLRLTALRSGDTLTISVEDDGAGVDLDAVQARGKASGLLGPNPTREETLGLLFIPGFSTRSSADTAAGRGVGLDVVRRDVLDLGGDVHVSSVVHKGTRFTLNVPIRAGTRGVLVVVCGHLRVAIPIERVRRVRLYEAGERSSCLASWLGLAEPSSSCTDVVEVTDGDRTIPLGVHAIEHAKDVVVRPLPTLLAGVGPWIGAIVEPEGGVLLVLDPLRIDRSSSYLRGQ